MFRKVEFYADNTVSESAVVSSLTRVENNESSILQQCNDHQDVIYAQFKKKGMYDERGNLMNTKIDLEYFKFKQLLLSQNHIAFITFDSFRDEIALVKGDPTITYIALVSEKGGKSKRYVFFDEYELDKSEYTIGVKSKLCVIVRAYMECVQDFVELVFLCSNRTEANSLSAALKKPNQILTLHGMLIPRVQKMRSGYPRMSNCVIVNDYDLTNDPFDDVKELIPKINSWKDVTYFRDYDKFEPLYTQVVNEICWFSIFYAESQKTPFNLILSGLPGTAKTSFISLSAKLFADDKRVVQATNSTIKGLIPSYSGDVPQVGYLASPGFFKAVDEIFRNPVSQGTVSGVDKKTGLIKEYLSKFLPLFTRDEQTYSSAKDDKFTAKMTASLIATDNLIEDVRVALSSIVREDPALLRRFVFLYLGEDEFEKIKVASNPPPGSEILPTLRSMWKNHYGYDVIKLERFAHWARSILRYIKPDAKRCYDMTIDVFVDEISKLLAGRGMLDQDKNRIMHIAKQIDYKDFASALVKCNAIMRCVYEEQDTVIPKIIVKDEDYDAAKVQFTRLVTDLLFLFESDFSQMAGGGGVVRV